MFFNAYSGKTYMSTKAVGHCFTDTMVSEIYEGALRILSEVGILITDDTLRGRLQAMGFAFSGNRVLLEAKQVHMFYESCKKLPNLTGGRKIIKTVEAFNCTVNEYCSNYMDINGAIRPYTTESLTAATKFVEKYAIKFGVSPNVAGYPSDVPAALQSLARFKICAQCCHEGYPTEPASLPAAEYMYRMCEVIGAKMERLTVYVASPLTLGGESLDIVLKYRDRLKTVKVTSMPSYGVSTPMNILSAFAVSLAESMGSALIVNALTGLATEFLCQLHPFDFRATSLVYGSPEQMLFGLVAAELNARLMGYEFQVKRANMHTLAKTPGIQAAAEKSSVITAGALLGARTFTGAGALSLDEIFSPVQYVLDLEMMSHTWRYISGLKMETMPDNLTELVLEGLSTGFMNTDFTLDNIDKLLWYPDFFTRKPLDAWQASGAKDALDAARAQVEKTMTEPDAFHLPDDKFQALEDIWESAVKNISI